MAGAGRSGGVVVGEDEGLLGVQLVLGLCDDGGAGGGDEAEQAVGCAPDPFVGSELQHREAEVGLASVVMTRQWGVVVVPGLAGWAVSVVGHGVVVVGWAAVSGEEAGGVGEDVAEGAELGAAFDVGGVFEAPQV